ncbi:sugar phosphate isomerase/epimerase family protein [Chloroflexota bacterium]
MSTIIGASLGSFKGLTIEQSLDLYLKLSRYYSLNAVEIRFEKEEGRPSMWYWEDYGISNFLKDFVIKGAHLPFIHLNPVSPNPGIREESMSQLKMSITKAAELDMDYAVMHASGLAQNLNRAQELAEWAKVMEELTGHARENGIVLTLENADSLWDLKDMATIVRQIDSNYLKITLDVGHAYIRRIPPLSAYPIKELALRALDVAGMPFIIKEGMPYERYGSIRQFLESEYDLIFCLHIHDYNGRRDHLNIGSGKADFSFLSILNKRGFTGPLILETEFKSDPAISVEDIFELNYKHLQDLLNN